MEEKLKNFTVKLSQSAPLLCGILIAIWWVFYGMVEIYPTSLGITDRIGLTVITIVFAITYCKLISVGGFNSAKERPEYKKLALEWTEAIKKGNQYKKEIIEYAKKIAAVNQKECRTKNLEEFGLKYEDIFDQDGNLIKLDYKKCKKEFTKNQRKCINRCIKIRINIPEMFGEISGKTFGIKKRTTQKQYKVRTDSKNTIMRTIVSIFTAGIMVKWLGVSAESVIYALLQIAVWSGSGVVQRINNYNFIINEIQPQIIENTLIINGYLETIKKEEVVA